MYSIDHFDTTIIYCVALQLDTKHDKSSKVRYLAGFDGIHDILQAASAFQESNSKIHHHHPTDDDSIEGYQVSVHR